MQSLRFSKAEYVKDMIGHFSCMRMLYEDDVASLVATATTCASTALKKFGKYLHPALDIYLLQAIFFPKGLAELLSGGQEITDVIEIGRLIGLVHSIDLRGKLDLDIEWCICA